MPDTAGSAARSEAFVPSFRLVQPATNPATLKDVAHLAGVSPKTVSNVINGYAPVSDTTRLRVQEAAAELDYRPNPVARALRSGAGTPLTLLVPTVCAPELTDLVRSMITLARASGLHVVTGSALATEDQNCLVVLGSPEVLRATTALP